MCSNQRRKVNHISKVEDAEENVFTNLDDINIAFIYYYQQLFSNFGPTRIDVCVESSYHLANALVLYDNGDCSYACEKIHIYVENHMEDGCS